MWRGLAVAAALALTAAACSASEPSPTHRLIGFNFVVDDLNVRTELVTLDPKTLRAHGRILRIDDGLVDETDASATSAVGQLSPDRKTLAVGTSSGRVLLLDPARLRRAGSISVRRGSDVVVAADSWPRADRLLVVYGLFSTFNTWGDSLAVIDPTSRKVLNRTRLNGFVEHAEKQKNGSLLLLVRRRGSPPRVVAVSPGGHIRSFPLPAAVGLPGQHVGSRFFAARAWPAVATDGEGHAFVVREGSPLLEVDVASGRVRAHAVALTRSSLGLPQPPPWPAGSRGPELVYGRSVRWLGRGLIGIGGGVNRPVRIGGQIGQRYRPYGYEVVDTRTWRIVRKMGLTGCDAAFGVYLCSESVGGFPPDSKGSRGSSLVTFDRSWKLLYRKRSRSLWRDVIAGRFLAGEADGSRMSVLDPRTGGVVRRLGSMRVWPPELLDWRAG